MRTGAAFVGVAAFAAEGEMVPVLAKLFPLSMIRLALPDLPETLVAEVTQGKLLIRVVGTFADHAVPVDRGMVP